MSELPDNWEEIKSDKAFWDEVKRMMAAGELTEAEYYKQAVTHLTTGANFNDEDYGPEEYDYELHELAIAAVLNSKNVFSVFMKINMAKTRVHL